MDGPNAWFLHPPRGRNSSSAFFRISRKVDRRVVIAGFMVEINGSKGWGGEGRRWTRKMEGAVDESERRSSKRWTNCTVYPHGPRLFAVNGIAVLERCGSTADKWHFAYDFAFKARGKSPSRPRFTDIIQADGNRARRRASSIEISLFLIDYASDMQGLRGSIIWFLIRDGNCRGIIIFLDTAWRGVENIDSLTRGDRIGKISGYRKLWSL